MSLDFPFVILIGTKMNTNLEMFGRIQLFPSLRYD